MNSRGNYFSFVGWIKQIASIEGSGCLRLQRSSTTVRKMAKRKYWEHEQEKKGQKPFSRSLCEIIKRIKQWSGSSNDY